MGGTTVMRNTAQREESRVAGVRRRLLRAVDAPELSPAKLASSLLDVLVEEITSAGGALVLMHPQTGLFWTGAVAALPAASCHPFFTVEVTSDSPRTFRRLAAAGASATGLSLHSGGQDPLLTRVLAPHGYTDELRVVCRDAGTVWGGVSLWRDRDTFRAEEERVLDAVSDLIGRVLRDAVLRSLEQVAGAPESRGMIVVEADEVVEVSAEGTAFLREIDDPDVEEYRHLDHLLALARTTPRFSTVLGTVDGQWLCAHGTPLTSGRVAIVLSSAAPADLMGPRVAGAGLTGREVEVTRHLCRGLSDSEIAQQLGISPHTVHDHVRAVRRKLGVRSRGEISALVFAEHYLPDFLDSAEVTHRAT